MKNWSLGRIDFSLTEPFKLTGRTHSIYHVNVITSSLNEITALEFWNNRLKQIEALHVDNNKNDPVIIKEIASGFPVAIYRENSSNPELIKLEAQKQVDSKILTLKYEGKAGKEHNIIQLLSITAEGYKSDIPYGFNVGAGSIISNPSRNESATANFTDNNHVELKVVINTAGTYLTSHPLDDIEYEIKGLFQDGIILKVLKNDNKVVAGFNGHEGIISIESQNEEPEFRFTWFTPGVTADSFNPEIMIKAHGPLKYIEEFKTTWDKILDSLKMRKSSM